MNKRDWLIAGIAAVLLSSLIGFGVCQNALLLCDPQYTEIIGQDCHFTSSIITLFIMFIALTSPFFFVLLGVSVFVFNLIRRAI